MRTIWNGEGALGDGEASYTTREGIIRGRPYVRQYVARKLSHKRRMGLWTREREREAIAATIDNDAWMAQRNGSLVSSICRDVETHLWET